MKKNTLSKIIFGLSPIVLSSLIVPLSSCQKITPGDCDFRVEGGTTDFKEINGDYEDDKTWSLIKENKTSDLRTIWSIEYEDKLNSTQNNKFSQNNEVVKISKTGRVSIHPISLHSNSTVYFRVVAKVKQESVKSEIVKFTYVQSETFSIAGGRQYLYVSNKEIFKDDQWRLYRNSDPIDHSDVFWSISSQDQIVKNSVTISNQGILTIDPEKGGMLENVKYTFDICALYNEKEYKTNQPITVTYVPEDNFNIRGGTTNFGKIYESTQDIAPWKVYKGNKEYESIYQFEILSDTQELIQTRAVEILDNGYVRITPSFLDHDKFYGATLTFSIRVRIKDTTFAYSDTISFVYEKENQIFVSGGTTDFGTIEDVKIDQKKWILYDGEEVLEPDQWLIQSVGEDLSSYVTIAKTSTGGRIEIYPKGLTSGTYQFNVIAMYKDVAYRSNTPIQFFYAPKKDYKVTDGTRNFGIVSSKKTDENRWNLYESGTLITSSITWKVIWDGASLGNDVVTISNDGYVSIDPSKFKDKETAICNDYSFFVVAEYNDTQIMSDKIMFRYDHQYKVMGGSTGQIAQHVEVGGSWTDSKQWNLFDDTGVKVDQSTKGLSFTVVDAATLREYKNISIVNGQITALWHTSCSAKTINLLVIATYNGYEWQAAETFSLIFD